MVSICEQIKTGDELDVLGSLVPVAVAGIGEALVAVAAGEGPAPGVHDGMLHHVRLGFGDVAAVPALTGGKAGVGILLLITSDLENIYHSERSTKAYGNGN
jgi:hypothetical protein